MASTIIGQSPISFPFSFSFDLNNKPGVYAIVNFANGKFYVGSSNKVAHRIAQHKHELEKGVHKNEYLMNAYRKNKQEFRFVVLEYTESFQQREQEFLNDLFDNHDSCYNLSSTAKHPSFSKETREKIKNNMIAIHQKDTTRRLHLVHYNQTPEARLQQSLLAIAQRQDPNYTKQLIEHVRKAKQKHYDIWLLGPDTELHYIGWNLAEFCRKHGLNPANLSKVINQKAKSHMGWSLPKRSWS